MQNEIEDRLVRSDSFGKSDNNVNLLKYFLECTNSKNVPKETTIGTHLFGLNSADNYDRTKVRVYVFNLCISTFKMKGREKG